MAPPFGPGSFDAVTNRHLLWTLTDPATALRNWHALLRPGGVLVVIDGIWPHDDDEHERASEEGRIGGSTWSVDRGAIPPNIGQKT